MFEKILIANRGEIACRVIKTARRMGIETVAVYSDADRDAVHVKMADEAVRIGPPASAESYLVIDAVLNACRQTGVDAVHPGYGFLSESAAFAQALDAAGIAFIGPPVKAIEVMGDKIESKKFADAAKVNTVPGHIGTVANGDEAVKIADTIGYPVMIKASAGGGGKGMRVAYSEDETREGFDRARSEAASSFGDDRIFIEKFVEQPRHIEIQVLADGHGTVLHLNERECSIQRRNQKVIEEAPSPFLDDKTRAAMGGQAVALAAAVGYQSAGTVEFIVDKNRHFYFLEMNTRLQVEHPVTELITGIDLVEQMIRVAAGEKLSLQQSDIGIKGWAIESRVYAEDPYRNFMPSIGRLTAYRPPAQGTAHGLTIRNDTGVTEGSEISMYYDPMIAKLVTHGPDRESAIDHMLGALDAFTLDGIRHNIPFLSALMDHPRWREGALTTGFIAEEFPDGFQGAAAHDGITDTMVCIAAQIGGFMTWRAANISGRLGPVQDEGAQHLAVMLGPDRHDVTLEDSEGGEIDVLIGVGDAAASYRIVTDWMPGALVWSGLIDGREISAQVRGSGTRFHISHHGFETDVRVIAPHIADLMPLMPEKKAADTSKTLLCPMPGLLVSLAVEEGASVQAGDTLCVVEAMKMENVLRAERDSIVAKINAAPGESLRVDAVIMEFE